MLKLRCHCTWNNYQICPVLKRDGDPEHYPLLEALCWLAIVKAVSSHCQDASEHIYGCRQNIFGYGTRQRGSSFMGHDTNIIGLDGVTA